MAVIVEPTPIQPGVLYTLGDFTKITGLGKHAMRTARNRGLRVRRVGNRAFVSGSDFLDYVDRMDSEQSEEAGE